MINYDKLGIYNIIAHIYDDKNIYIDIAFKGNHPRQNLVIINRFKQTKENENIFREIFNYYSSNKKSEKFIDFFADQNYFCAVFKYKEEANLKYRYQKKFCSEKFEIRIKIFESILISIYNMTNDKFIPRLILKNITKSQNIFVDENSLYYFNYDLRDYSDNVEDSEDIIFEKLIFKNISKIISIIFEIEASSKYNKIIQVILKKCELGLYPSIPALVVEFKKNSNALKVSSFWTHLKYHMNLRKPSIIKIANSIMIPGLLFVFFYLMYTQLFKKETRNPRQVTIGNITYSAGAKDKTSKIIPPDNGIIIAAQKPETPLEIVPSGTRLEFEDHIVKNGDTLLELSLLYYGDEKFVSALASFNNLDPKDKLFPGSILRIPTKSSLARFYENNSD